MKEIKAIIQPLMLSKVISALKELEGLPGVTVDTSVRGFGKGGRSPGARTDSGGLCRVCTQSKAGDRGS